MVEYESAIFQSPLVGTLRTALEADTLPPCRRACRVAMALHLPVVFPAGLAGALRVSSHAFFHDLCGGICGAQNQGRSGASRQHRATRVIRELLEIRPRKRV